MDLRPDPLIGSAASPPLLSVVVPSVNGAADLLGCLAALEAEAVQVPLEVLVADRVGPSLRQQVSRRHPWVRLLEGPANTSIPELRAMAFATATAAVVAVIEDHVLVPPGWARQMLNAQARGEQVVGGAVINGATERLIDWAAFLCEYSHLLPPLAAGEVPALTGNNTTYRRELLERFRATVTSGRWEDHLHRELRRHGVQLFCHPEIVVRHKKHYSIAEYSSQRFLYARSYAGTRVAGWTLAHRLAYGAAAALLPPVLLARIAARVWSRPPYRLTLLRSLPLLLLFVVAWAAGEITGAWLGPGDAMHRVC